MAEEGEPPPQHPAPSTQHSPSLAAWAMLAIAVLTQVSVALLTQGVPTLTPFIQSDLGLTRAEAALFGSALMAGSLAALFAAGWAVDAYGERRVLVWGNLAVGLCCLAVAATHQIGPALAALFAVGIGSAVPTPAGSKAVMIWFRAGQRDLAMGVRQTAIPIGGALAALLFPWLALGYGWRSAVVAGAASCFGAALVCWALYRRPEGSAGDAITTRAPGFGLRDLLTRDVLLLGVGGMLLPLGQFCLVTYLALFLKETNGVPIETSAALLIEAQIAGAVGRIAWGIFSDRCWGGRRQPPLLAANVLAAICALVLGWLPHALPMPLLALVIGVYGFTAIGWHGNWTALLAEIGGAERGGRTIGLAMTIMYVGIIAGPPLFGYVVDLTGDWPLAWTLLAGALGVGCALIAPVREGVGS